MPENDFSPIAYVVIMAAVTVVVAGIVNSVGKAGVGIDGACGSDTSSSIG